MPQRHSSGGEAGNTLPARKVLARCLNATPVVFFAQKNLH
jgi:hypothetical protein